jgi:DMSO/TMAO reductase YedYZ molybdopterin-dependent catalytic subunit
MAKREGIKPPKFAGEFAVCDFEADPMPVLSLYAPPPETPLAAWRIGVSDGPRRFEIDAVDLEDLPRVRERRFLICQIFNWREEVAWEGVRLCDLLAAFQVRPRHDAYLSFSSADGKYFETLPQAMACDPRVLVAFGMNDAPLPHAHGGPVRLVVPFLQGYKSVKWLAGIDVVPADPLGTKRTLGQSRTAYLSGADLQDLVDTVTVAPAEGGYLAEV